MTIQKEIPLKEFFVKSFEYVREHQKLFYGCSFLHILLAVIGFKLIDGWHDFFFFPWLMAYYVFWCIFFRYYFKRKPYFFFKKICDSLVPSTKILALFFLVVTIFLILPFIPPFFGVGTEWGAKYDKYLQLYMEDSHLVDMVTLGILTLVAPFILYRPMMAWISSIIGRSGSLKTAFARTKGNYWKMFSLMALFEILFTLLELTGECLGVNNWLFLIFGSPLMVYLNIIMAKTYEYFFLEIDR